MEREGFKTPEDMAESRRKIRKEIDKVLDELRLEYDISVSKETPETPETITLVVRGKDGKERTMGFMKMSGIEKIIKERIENPED